MSERLHQIPEQGPRSLHQVPMLPRRVGVFLDRRLMPVQLRCVVSGRLITGCPVCHTLCRT